MLCELLAAKVWWQVMEDFCFLLIEISNLLSDRGHLKIGIPLKQYKEGSARVLDRCQLHCMQQSFIFVDNRNLGTFRVGPKLPILSYHLSSSATTVQKSAKMHLSVPPSFKGYIRVPFRFPNMLKINAQFDALFGNRLLHALLHFD